MKSLQIVTPHQECMFNCPFCIAKAHLHQNHFDNNYEDNYLYWKEKLVSTILNNEDLGYVVITGTNEPMQSKDCVNDIIDTIRKVNKNIQIEIQTRYYPQDELYDKLDVVAYSISNPKMIKNIKPRGKIQRYVFILTDLFNNYSLDDILSLMPGSVSQVTFKTLQDSCGENLEFDNYINNHRLDGNTLNLLKEDITKYKGNLSIRLDMNCMDSIGRYKIFREDGNLYDTWDDYNTEKNKTYALQ